VNFSDINPFVLALSDYPAYLAAYPGCSPENADVNADGNTNFGDITRLSRSCRQRRAMPVSPWWVDAGLIPVLGRDTGFSDGRPSRTECEAAQSVYCVKTKQCP